MNYQSTGIGLMLFPVKASIVRSIICRSIVCSYNYGKEKKICIIVVNNKPIKNEIVLDLLCEPIGKEDVTHDRME